MAQTLVLALDVTEAISAVLGGLARAYHREPGSVGDVLEELAEVERIMDSLPELGVEGMVEARRDLLSQLMALACKTD